MALENPSRFKLPSESETDRVGTKYDKDTNINADAKNKNNALGPGALIKRNMTRNMIPKEKGSKRLIRRTL